MSMFDWLAARFSKRKQALLTYKRGIRKAQQHDHAGAIEDYTGVIATGETPADIRAMALFNRALVFDSVGDHAKAEKDLNAILEMKQDIGQIKTEARRRLVRTQRRSR